MNLVEEKFGNEVVDKRIVSAKLDNDNAFTTVGTYDHADLLKMVIAQSHEVNIQVPTLVKIFGRHLYLVFSRNCADRLSHLKVSFK